MNQASKGRIFQNYNTDAEPINQLMCALLGDVSGLDVLEPCAGEGAFITGLQGLPASVDGIEVNTGSSQILREKFGERVRVHSGDFIDHFVSSNSPIPLKPNYDALICNPPYGLKYSLDYRKKIKQALPGFYARESYGLFIRWAIPCLKDGGRFVFIVPDTFLTSTNHRPLRDFLVKEVTLTHLVQFDSEQFESIHFGYGQLCILAGLKGTSPKLKLKWLQGGAGPLNLGAFRTATSVSQSDLVNAARDGWVHPRARQLLEINRKCQPLSELAECKTGIYSGDNKKYCAYDQSNPPARKNGHPISWNEMVCTAPMSAKEKIQGLAGKKSYVALIRGGHRGVFEKTSSAILWSQAAVQDYRSNPKTRLQNTAYYFRKGLAVPMVTSGRISASMMEHAIFDQGVVGVFPKEERYLSFLLLYLNSKFVSHVVKPCINPSANNSANYIKRIPVPIPTDQELAAADAMVEKYAKAQCVGLTGEIEDFFRKILQSSSASDKGR
jgi:hypothetical protein